MSLELVADTALLTVGTTSSKVSVPLPANMTSWSHDIAIVNTGSALAYVAIGPAAAIPTEGVPEAGYPVAAGGTVVLHAPTAGITEISAIGTTATTLYVTACILAA